MKLNLGDIAQRLGLQLIGDGSLAVEGIAPLATATSRHISFLANARFARYLAETAAAAVIVKPQFRDQCRTAVLLSDDPYLAFASLTALFDESPVPEPGIHPSAVIGPGACIEPSASVGAHVVIGANVVIGAHTVIEPNTVVADNCKIGWRCHLHANVTLYHGVRMGNEVTIHSGAVIGADGFGFAPTPQRTWRKIHQLGAVVIGDRVDIGANTCIDRGALEDTVIGNGVIIDNQVQIAHNCIIGDNTAIAGCVGIAGSTVIGRNCTLAGGVGVAGHLEITDNVHVTSMSLVTGSILQAGSWSSGTAIMETRAWRRNAVRFTQLEQMHDRLKKIEKNAD